MRPVGDSAPWRAGRIPGLELAITPTSAKRIRMKRPKPASEGGRPRRPHRQRKSILESLERRDLLATLDPTFATGGTATFQFEAVGGVDAEYGDIARQADGKFVLVGSAIGPLGNRDFAIVRLNPDGTVDTTFNQGKGAKLVPFDVNGG